MSESYQIIWSPIAEETYLKILQDIRVKWSIKEAIAFDNKVEDLISKLKSFKDLCPPSGKHSNYRRCVISKQISVVYTVRKNIIELVTFYDNRSEHNF